MFVAVRSLVLIVLLALGLSACGPSSSSDSSSSSDDEDTSSADNGSENGAGKSISGSVLGSYIVGATICLDENENGRCDTSDTFRTTTTADGNYSFEDVPDDIFEKTIIVEIPATATIVDPITGASTEAASEYRLSFPPSTDSDRFVSSLSTLVNSEFMKSGDLESAKQSVSNTIGASNPDDVLGNFVEKGTADSAGDDDRKLYNVAKYTGNAMQRAQTDTGSDLNNDANMLLNLVTEKIIENIGSIERAAREANGIVTQEEAVAFASDLDRNSGLNISSEELATAEALANTSFALGRAEVTVNYIDEEGESGWQRQFMTVFNLPQPTNLSLEDFKASVPSDYEIGLYNDSGTLEHAYGFNEPQWDDTADIRYFYGLDGEGSSFSVFARDYSGGQVPQAGDYTVELCTEGCGNLTGEDGQINIGEKTIIELAESSVSSTDDLMDILDGQDEGSIEFYTSAGDEMVRDGHQVIFVNQPAPAVGAASRVTFGPASNGTSAPDTRYQANTLESLNRIYVPKVEFDQLDGEDLVVSLEVRDATKYEDISYISRTQYKPIPDGIERRESFVMDEVYTKLFTENVYGRPFVEGGEITPLIYIADNNPLVGLRFEDESGDIIGSEICLPDNMPKTQQEIADLPDRLEHWGNGSEYAFEGCEQDIQDVFDLAPVTDHVSWVEIEPEYSGKYDVNYLFMLMQFRTDDTDGTWTETESESGVNFFKDVHHMVLEFENGEVQKYYVDIQIPENNHDFSSSTDDWSMDGCYTNQGNLKISLSPASWYQDEFDNNELSLRVQLNGYQDELPQRTESFTIRSMRGAQSVIVPAQMLDIIGNNPDTTDLEVSLDVGDMDEYEWKRTTWWASYRETYSWTEVEQAPDCQE